MPWEIIIQFKPRHPGCYLMEGRSDRAGGMVCFWPVASVTFLVHADPVHFETDGERSMRMITTAVAADGLV